MPTRDVLASFWRDWDQLSPKQQREFRTAVAQFIANLAEDKQGFHPRLRVKRVQGHPGVGDDLGLQRPGDLPVRRRSPSWTATHHLAPHRHPFRLPSPLTY